VTVRKNLPVLLVVAGPMEIPFRRRFTDEFGG
jgi:hypothetical protein